MTSTTTTTISPSIPRHGPTPTHLSPSSIESISGLSAGLVSTFIVHPLDIIKTRLQLSTSPTTFTGASLSVFRGIFHNEGPTRLAALYRGLTPNLVGNSAGWALYFLWYKQAQDLIRGYRGYDAKQSLTSVDYLYASAASGALSAVLTNPIWVVKTRMLSTSATTEGAYASMWQGLKSIQRTEGVRGYFHGLTPTLVGVSHGALYFVAYEKLKVWLGERRARHGSTNNKLTNTDTLLASSLSKVFAGTITYPHQLVRARMQTYDPAATIAAATTITPQSPPTTSNVTLRGIVRSVWHNEGLVGFYKGLGPNLLRVVPSTCVTFLVYENVRWGLGRVVEDNTNEETRL